MDFTNLESVSGIEPLTDDTAREFTGGEDRGPGYYLGYAWGYVSENADDFAEGVYDAFTDDD
jgi:hypothetical protein